MNELYWQRKIIKRMQEDGAYAKKWSSQWSVGVPDIIAVYGGRAMFIEVKFGEVSDFDRLNRRVKITPRQKHELESLHAAGAKTKIIYVGHRGRNDTRLFDIDLNTLRVDTSNFYFNWTTKKDINLFLMTPTTHCVYVG